MGCSRSPCPGLRRILVTALRSRCARLSKASRMQGFQWCWQFQTFSSSSGVLESCYYGFFQRSDRCYGTCVLSLVYAELVYGFSVCSWFSSQPLFIGLTWILGFLTSSEILNTTSIPNIKRFGCFRYREKLQNLYSHAIPNTNYQMF